jgi:hypothetical protein
MGRPLPRKLFGPTDTTSPYSGSTWSADGSDPQGRDHTSNSAAAKKGYNIPVYKARIAGEAMDSDSPYILSQKGSRKFKVRTAAGDGTCRLVNNDAADIAEGEMVLQGFVDADGTPVYIQKINKNKAYDFSGNSYHWYVDNDSTANIIMLVV